MKYEELVKYAQANSGFILFAWGTKNKDGSYLQIARNIRNPQENDLRTFLYKNNLDINYIASDFNDIVYNLPQGQKDAQIILVYGKVNQYNEIEVVYNEISDYQNLPDREEEVKEGFFYDLFGILPKKRIVKVKVDPQPIYTQVKKKQIIRNPPLNYLTTLDKEEDISFIYFGYRRIGYDDSRREANPVNGLLMTDDKNF